MVKRRHNGQRRRLSLATLGAIILSAPMMTGCSATPTTAQHSMDPLHGYLTPPGQAPLPNSAPRMTNTPIAAPQTSSINGVPIIPTNNTASNPATLAGTSGFQGPLGKPLAIDDEGRAQTTARSQPSGFIPANPSPKFEAVPDASANSQAVLPTGSWQLPASNVPPALPADGLRQQLQARGVVDQKVDPVADGVRLTCYVTRNDAQGLRVVEVTRADYAAAAQAILLQLDQGNP